MWGVIDFLLSVILQIISTIEIYLLDIHHIHWYDRTSTVWMINLQSC
jgi:hypothetical protein